MKKIILYMTLCLIGMVQVACDQDIDGFDNSTNYIYFDLPFQLDQYGRKTTERVDSLVYSFAMDDPSVTSYTFKIPVNSVGLKTETDRHYKVVVNEKKTTATGTDWDMSVIEKAVIQSGTLRDTLEVKVNRTPILKKESRTITLYIENNENEKALDYINEVIHTSDKTALQRYCKNNIVNLILSSHEGEMKKKQITFQYTIQIPEKLRISDVDLTALLSNGLENAIHAVSDLPMPKRIIRLDMNHDKLLISLKNTYAIKPQIIDGLPYTSEAGHGFGTKSIWYVAEKQNGNCQFMVDDRFFTMRIIL